MKEHSQEENRQEKKGVIDSLALMPEKTLLDEPSLAAALRVSTRTIRRMVNRLELPPPVRLGGRSFWMVGKVLQHIEAALDQVEREAAREFQRIRKFSP